MPIPPGTHILHTVQGGDTLYQIANRYESDVEAIVEANGIYPPFTDPYLIFPGQVLIVPKIISNLSNTLYVVQNGDTVGSIAFRFSAHPDLLIGTNYSIQNPNYIFPNQQLLLPAYIYEIESGDTLSGISTRTGASIEEILRANANRPAISPDLIYPGTQMIIPLPSSRNIIVTQPLPGSSVSDGSILEGYARAFEANVLYRLLDFNQNEIIEETFTTAEYGAPTYGRFRTNLTFDRAPSTQRGELQVYTRSAQDGSVQDLVRLGIQFNT
ncbi:peptidoglycan-binding LysM [Halalkalibacillus sediminis]|uniref:Peptidoglycan-binding LysM n=2 Tax=Halalkalibacillus sediminis TaxID=2018042 RepID=A0A2I0QSB3_9BACI|nr:peptidoglycan-binding LysM [Halalkalibacillus sediminis]